MSPIVTLDCDSWSGGLGEAEKAEALKALETGHVLFFPHLTFRVDEADRPALAAAAEDKLAKNISYDPATGAVGGKTLSDDDRRALSGVMKRFSDGVAALMADLAPGYAPGLHRGRASFRPTEITDRAIEWRKDDRLLHVDSFPNRPNRGRRILRVFSNIDPDGKPRRWKIGEPFEAHAKRFLPAVKPPVPGKSLWLKATGVTHGTRSRYDHIMLELHDAAKRDTAYQTGEPYARFDFPAGATWMVFTDLVPHAVLGGKFALEQTYSVDTEVMQDPNRAPIRILERLTERALA